mmetsp:Transcript_14423/g.36487  ORF Transcript_14423/g.36487 Transcript_14423/m.36487 type:complete len:206 (-) Transcript_14423:990-1607(-)
MQGSEAFSVLQQFETELPSTHFYNTRTHIYAVTATISSSAATPGRTLPSRSSRLAPPPVEMWLILLATPAFSTAATESPPPMMVVHPFALSFARVSAMPVVPLAKASNSKTPIGPFHTTVLQSDRASWNTLRLSGPMSRPIQPSGMLSTDATLVSASAANLSARMTSVGSKNSTPFSLAFFSRLRASFTLSSSTKEDPTESPRAT